MARDFVPPSYGESQPISVADETAARRLIARLAMPFDEKEIADVEDGATNVTGFREGEYRLPHRTSRVWVQHETTAFVVPHHEGLGAEISLYQGWELQVFQRLRRLDNHTALARRARFNFSDDGSTPGSSNVLSQFEVSPGIISFRPREEVIEEIGRLAFGTGLLTSEETPEQLAQRQAAEETRERLRDYESFYGHAQQAWVMATLSEANATGLTVSPPHQWHDHFYPIKSAR